VTAAGGGVLLFGGAFHPPHRAHRALLAAALEQLAPHGVTRAIVLPAGRHPFKPGADLAPGPARLELCRLAFAGLPGVEVSDHELQPGHSGFTVDTVRHVQREVPGARLFLLIGADNLAQLPLWRQPQAILALVTLVVVPRPGAPPPAVPAGARAVMLRFAPDDVSSSAIRAKLRAGEDVAGLVAPAVLRRIRELGLYRTR
jgi:nicotinate-nucleotide adenylyltransferase